jgi:hypothetical protein
MSPNRASGTVVLAPSAISLSSVGTALERELSTFIADLEACSTRTASGGLRIDGWYEAHLLSEMCQPLFNRAESVAGVAFELQRDHPTDNSDEAAYRSRLRVAGYKTTRALLLAVRESDSWPLEQSNEWGRRYHEGDIVGPTALKCLASALTLLRSTRGGGRSDAITLPTMVENERASELRAGGVSLADRLRRRLTSPAAIERAVSVLSALEAFRGTWLTSRDLEATGLSPKTVFAEAGNGAWEKDVDYVGSGSASRSYSKARLIRYVLEKWSPRRTGRTK